MSAITEKQPAAPEPKTESDRERQYDWPLCYEAENLVLEQLDQFLKGNTFARTLAERMRTQTGTLFLDWVDYLALPMETGRALHAVGFVVDPLGETEDGTEVLHHPAAMLPRVLLKSASVASPSEVGIRADRVKDFLVAHGLDSQPDGAPMSRFRRALVAAEGDTHLYVIERRGYRGYVPGRHRPGELEALLQARELWQTRSRNRGNDAKDYEHAHVVLDRVIELVGRDLACHVTFEGERIYWQGRNRAAQYQKQRQDTLGLGWANHDHHTFRSSRNQFLHLMLALDKLGFARRERYYTGAQAGWGAQISEQAVEGIVTFCDVDLTPEETEIDFSRQPLSPAPKLGTIGLWVGLHGESFLGAGMHHLECRFDHQLLREQMAAGQIQTMKPFSDFPFLKQAFTEGERWSVEKKRVEHLLQLGLISQEQSATFLRGGAIGSHLENLQRRGGFKGFNQKSVSVIIDATDPRKQSGH